MPGGRCSPCHPTTAARSLPVPPGFLSVPRAKDALEARAHSPSPHSEPAAAICQLLLFPKKKPRARPRSERQRTPKTSGPGERVEHRRRQSPLSASSPPLLPFSYVFGWDCGCAGRVLSWEPAGRRRSPKVPGGCSPWALPVWGGRGAEAPTAIGNKPGPEREREVKGFSSGAGC